MTVPLTTSAPISPFVNRRGSDAVSPLHQNTLQQSPQDIFDPNRVQYDPHKIDAKTGQLSPFQKLCTFLIKNVYHPLTRGKYGLYKLIPIRCMFKQAGKLSCSEYTMEAIQELGTLRGIFEGFYRILRCNPINSVFLKHTEDPVFIKSPKASLKTPHPDFGFA